MVAALTSLATLVGLWLTVITWCTVRRRKRLTHTGLTLESESGNPVLDNVAGVGERADWWDRAKWAIDMALDDKPERRKVGLAVLDQLSTSQFVGNEEAQIVAQAKMVLGGR